MAIMITADWHLSARPKYAYRFKVAERVRDMCVDLKVDHLFMLGDLTDESGHDGHSAVFVDRVVELLLSFPCPVIILLGNHDTSDPKVVFFKFLGYIEPITYLTDTTPIILEGRMFLFVPYHEPIPVNLRGVDYVLAHHIIQGAKSSEGAMLKGEYLPPGKVPIISGDVHRPQQLGRVTYVGAPFDEPEARVLTLDAVGLKSHRITKVPRRLTVEVEIDPKGRLIVPKRSYNEGDMVKFRIKLSNLPLGLAKIGEDLRDFAASKGVEFEGLVPVLDKREQPLPPEPLTIKDSDLVDQYAVTHKLEEAARLTGHEIIGS